MIRDKLPCPWLIDWRNPKSIDLFRTDYLGLQEYYLPDELELVSIDELDVGDLVFALRNVHIGFNDGGPQKVDCKGLYPATIARNTADNANRLWLRTLDRTPSSPSGTGFLEKDDLLPADEPLYRRRLLALPYLKS